MLSNSVPSWPIGKVFVLSAPSGAGKTTLAKKLVATFPNIEIIPTTTTREQRMREENGKEYNFISTDEFMQKIEREELLEYICLHDNYYGTSKESIDKARLSGKHVILVIDTRGAKKVQKEYGATLIFVKTPNIDILIDRLEKRKSEDKETLRKRIAWAKEELREESLFEYSIVNDSLEEAFTVLSSIVIAETHKIQRESV